MSPQATASGGGIPGGSVSRISVWQKNGRNNMYIETFDSAYQVIDGLVMFSP